MRTVKLNCTHHTGLNCDQIDVNSSFHGVPEREVPCGYGSIGNSNELFDMSHKAENIGAHENIGSGRDMDKHVHYFGKLDFRS